MPGLTILIIRHAEKPKEEWPGPGLTVDGAPDDKSLVIRGWQRAGAWSALFGAGLGGDDFPKPDVIYAASPGDANDPNNAVSQRPFETATPLAAKLGPPPITKFAQGDEADLAKEVLKRTGIVLIAWEHKKIVEALLPAIASGADLALPAKWPGDRFDLVLRFDRASADAPWRFRQLFPMLLSGDSDLKI